MSVVSPDKKMIALGRSIGLPDGMYSSLAGFLEPGEVTLFFFKSYSILHHKVNL